MAKLGITRVANVTGLDYLGVPVFMATRPNACSLSVAQGKGLTEENAIASALMEAAEIAHVEDVRQPVTVASYDDLSRRANVADPARLPRLKRLEFASELPIPWLEGTDIAHREPLFIPFELVQMRLVLPSPFESAGFFCSSSGLASGNHRLEAICAGICEVIERDALALWNTQSTFERAARRVVLESVPAADAGDLITQLEDRAMSVAIWDITTDVGVASYLCCLSEQEDNDRSALGPFWGSGCHLDRGVALARAVTEAAQSRLTVIAGSRDDLKKSDYRRSDPHKLFALVHERWEGNVAVRRFTDAPLLAADDFETDVVTLVGRLSAVGLGQVVVADLTSDQIGIPVVRVIVPGLEPYDSEGRAKSGHRAKSWRRKNPA